MCEMWKMKGGTSDDKNNSDEVALVDPMALSKRKKKCWHCNKEGHKWYVCTKYLQAKKDDMLGTGGHGDGQCRSGG